MDIIKADNVCYEYKKYNENGDLISSKTALESLSLNVKDGEFVAILGHNGSGKSTLARLFNALLKATKGDIYICGNNTKDTDKLFDIRKSCGMVFQNPDNQIIASVVEEDVAFGLENLGCPTDEIIKRVDIALEKVGMLDYKKSSPNNLSGGQKQRVAIAGVLAMKPTCIILDESTAMLDPNGRKEIIDSIKYLNKHENITIILITHYMEEAVEADKVYVMSEGKIVMKGKPSEVFSKEEEIKKYNLELPQVTKLANELKKKGIPISKTILTTSELVEELDKVLSK